MFSLLLAPLRRGKRELNQFFLFLKTAGRILDGAREDLFRVREEACLITASPVMLPVHGQDRDAPRLKGEDDETYRTRLILKGRTAAMAGTREGLLLALETLGWGRSRIERMSLTEPERWAEFRVWLEGDGVPGVNDLAVVDAQVRRVKPAGTKPCYGWQAGDTVELSASLRGGVTPVPLCGVTFCGQWPPAADAGMIREDLGR